MRRLKQSYVSASRTGRESRMYYALKVPAPQYWRGYVGEGGQRGASAEIYTRNCEFGSARMLRG